jgi:hypothetical protein
MFAFMAFRVILAKIKYVKFRKVVPVLEIVSKSLNK